MREESSSGEGDRVLRFPCSCVTAADVREDPWASIAKQRKLQDGTKELILNAIHRSPRTIAQLAGELGLSQPTVHRHITELHSSELIREVTLPEEARQSSVERYYAPNFPVVLASDRQELLPALDAVAGEIAEIFHRHQADLADTFARTSMPTRGEHLDGLLHWLYTTSIRMARERLEEDGVLPSWPEHSDGSRWVWWAEESPDGRSPRH